MLCEWEVLSAVASQVVVDGGSGHDSYTVTLDRADYSSVMVTTA